VALAEAGAIRGRVLDVGCGTGEHALMAAELGLEATGVDVAAAAIAAAEAKAAERHLEVRFLVWNALDLAALGERFDTVLDCRQPGFFGPRRVTRDEIRASFADTWRVDAIEAATIETTGVRDSAQAWLATITRVEAAARMA
jgi:SAM-dependent methyltransferase